MDVELNQAQLRARMKLLKRHVGEWTTLSKTQREVRLNSRRSVDIPPNAFSIITKYGIRYDELLTRQSLERYQMSARHQQEELALDQTIKNSDPNSN